MLLKNMCRGNHKESNTAREYLPATITRRKHRAHSPYIAALLCDRNMCDFHTNRETEGQRGKKTWPEEASIKAEK